MGTHPFLFDTNATTNTRQETCLFQARGFLAKFARRIDRDPGKEALKWAGHLLLAAHCMGVFTEAVGPPFPLRGLMPW